MHLSKHIQVLVNIIMFTPKAVVLSPHHLLRVTGFSGHYEGLLWLEATPPVTVVMRGLQVALIFKVSANSLVDKPGWRGNIFCTWFPITAPTGKTPFEYNTLYTPMYWVVCPIQHTYVMGSIFHTAHMPVLGSMSHTAHLCSYWVACLVQHTYVLGSVSHTGTFHYQSHSLSTHWRCMRSERGLHTGVHTEHQTGWLKLTSTSLATESSPPR